MAVNVSKSGGIYIEISGDYTQLDKDLRAVRDLSKVVGAEISKSLENAIDPWRASSSVASLTQSMMKAQEAGKALSADFASQSNRLREWGQAIGVADKELEHFVALQAKALKNQNTRAFTSELRNLQRLTGESDEAMNRLAKSLGGTGTEFTKASRSTRDLCLNMTKLYIEAAKLAGLKMVWEGFKESFDLAARYETLGVVVQQVGKTAGYSAVEIDKNVSAIRRMGIAGIEARKTLTQLIQAQVDISKAPALARIAQDAAIIGGTDSSEAFERLVHGIQSANTQVLRGIGINVNFEKAYSKLAVALGKITGELTEQEKTQARLNAVIEEGKSIVGSYEAAMTTVGKQMTSLSRLHQDLGTDVGNFLLEIAKAAGFIDNYGKSLDVLSQIAIQSRAESLGISQTALVGLTTSEMRDIVEGFSAAKKEAESLELIMAALRAKGEDVSGISKPYEELKKTFFESAEEIKRLEKELATIARRGGDTSGVEAQIKAIQDRAISTIVDVNRLREGLASLFSLAQAKATGKGPSSHVEAYRQQLEAEEKKINDLFGKTVEGRKKAQQTIVDQLVKSYERLSKQDPAGELTTKARAALAKARKDLADIDKSSRAAGVAIERTAHQSAQAYKEAVDGLAALTMRTAELRAGLQGETLEASFEKINRKIETQLAKITSQRAKLEADARMWTKGGKMDAEARANVSLAQEQLDLQKQELEIQRELEQEQARRNALARDYRASMDYATLIGDARAYYAEEVNLLSLQMLGTSAAEKRTLAERQRIAAARRDLDISGLIQTGLQAESLKVYQDYIKFLEDIPSAAGNAADAIGTFAADVGTSAKSIGNAWSDLGNSLSSTIRKMIADLTSLYLRMALIGNLGQSGGKLGGLLGIIAGLFSGPGINSAGASWSTSAGDISIPDLDLASLFHTGGIVGQIAPSRIVAASAFADAPRYHSGGIAGLRPDERAAILRVGEEVITDIDPRHRNNLHTSSGAQSPQTNIQIVDQRGANAPEVEVQQTPNASGGIDFKLIIKSEQQRNFASGSMDNIMRNRYGIRPQVVGR